MMNNLVIEGRTAIPGLVEGFALVCPESIQGWAGIDDYTGVIIEHGHSQYGQSIDGKILVLPCAKGSNGWSGHFNSAAVSGIKPLGWVFNQIDSRAGVAAAILNIPTICDLEEDACAIIRTGDYIRIDGAKGRIEILHRAE